MALGSCFLANFGVGPKKLVSEVDSTLLGEDGSRVCFIAHFGVGPKSSVSEVEALSQGEDGSRVLGFCRS